MNRFAPLAVSPMAAAKNCAAFCGVLMVGGLICFAAPANTAFGQSDLVFMTADVSLFGPSKLVRFDAGTPTFAVDTGGSHNFFGLTVLNRELLVADQTADAIQRFSPDGTYLGTFATTGVNPNYLESDTSGNVYTTLYGPPIGQSLVRRYNSAGAETKTINFGTGRQLAGIDADANGNIYVAETTEKQLYKQAADGTYINQISLGFTPQDLAIDEVGKRLYMAAETGGIKIFDISAAVPSLVGSITTPANSEIEGVHFATESGNILATDLGILSNDPRGLEYLPSGTLLREYRPISATAALDIVTFVSLPGDYNINGVVDAADYTVWRDTLGSRTDLRADGDNTGASAERHRPSRLRRLEVAIRPVLVRPC